MTTAKYQRYKELALEKINPIIECIRCGCDDIRLLEINHIDGDGYEDSKIHGSGLNLYLRIINGQRITNDLNVMCRADNAIDHLERKVGHMLPMRVIWKNRGLVN